MPYLKIDRAALNQLKLQIFTHSIPLASPTSNTKATLITIGGKTGNMNLAPTGAQTLQPIKQVHLDLTAIRTSGLDTETEPSTTKTAEIDVKTEALHRNTPRISLVVSCPYQSDQSANKLPSNSS